MTHHFGLRSGCVLKRGRLRDVISNYQVLSSPLLAPRRCPIASSFLPGNPPYHPAERIILAAARDLGAALITRDLLQPKYGEDGQVSTILC
jgi:hypothetical protein